MSSQLDGQTSLFIDTEGELEKILQRMESLEEMLDAPSMLQRAVRSTAKKVRRQITKDALGHYALTDKSALTDESKGAPKVVSSSGTEISSTILSRGPMQEIMAFLTKPNTKTGAAAAKVWNSSTLKELKKGDLKAYVTQFASGHIAIVQRRGAARLPVKKLLSPAVPHMLDNDFVRARAEKMTYELLQKEIEKQIERALTGVA